MSGNKFIDKYKTAKNEDRAFVPFVELKTLWFNTGTLCNLSCQNCYIESSPKNDRLSYLTLADVGPFLHEIERENLMVRRIGFTGGEPFINPHFISILKTCLENDFEVVVLTNAHKVIKRHKEVLETLNHEYGVKMQLRVSLDHYSEEVHDKERGAGAFNETIKSLKWLSDNKFNISIGGRSLTGESQENAIKAYQEVLTKNDIDINLEAGKIVIFPEMDPFHDVPEITTACWDILKKLPKDQMCSSERMVVKRKGENFARVQACTLLAYQDEFTMGHNLKEAAQNVYLNHPFCAQFCVLGGASCSTT